VKLSKREGEVLDEALDVRLRYGEPTMSMVSSRSFPLHVIRRVIAKGLLVETDTLVVMVDADGFAFQPERYRVGYHLTEAGERIAKERAKR
jgi:hypothetical protein